MLILIQLFDTKYERQFPITAPVDCIWGAWNSWKPSCPKNSCVPNTNTVITRVKQKITQEKFGGKCSDQPEEDSPCETYCPGMTNQKLPYAIKLYHSLDL